MKIHPTFSQSVQWVREQLRAAPVIRTEKWQGIDTKPEMATHELLNVSFQVPVQHEDLELLALDIKPNLPWADDHFLERVGGQPLNPGVQWRNWPWALKADTFRTEVSGDEPQFNHTYMERFWPKYAGMTAGGLIRQFNRPVENHYGIRNDYGDLDDLVEQLRAEPNTRQAYLPIFFPEDTGGVYGGRVPCTLGYHFIHRQGYLHIIYYLRSCDFVRHFKDDIYLAVRLQLWVLDRLRQLDPEKWVKVSPGMYTMHITSMHLFVNDYRTVFNGKTGQK